VINLRTLVLLEHCPPSVNVHCPVFQDSKMASTSQVNGPLTLEDKATPHCLETLGNGQPAMQRTSQNNGVLYTSFFRGLIYLPMKETQF
jgi:hypothetical protein